MKSDPRLQAAMKKLQQQLHPPPLSPEEAKPIRRDWPDIGFTAVYAPTEYRDVVAYFSIYKHEGYHKDAATGEWTVPGFWKKDSASNIDQVFDPADSEPFFECSIKWDGCSHWDIESAHLCGREDLNSLHTAMNRVWDWARELNMDRL